MSESVGVDSVGSVAIYETSKNSELRDKVT